MSLAGDRRRRCCSACQRCRVLARGWRARWCPTSRTTTPPPAAGAWPLVGPRRISPAAQRVWCRSRARSSGSRVKCRFGGTTPCCSARTALISPSAPGGRLRCGRSWSSPMPARRGRRCRIPRPGWRIRWDHRPGCRCRAPRPCRRCAASTPAAANAARYTATCASCDGVAMFTVRPS